MISIENLTKEYGSKNIITNWHFTFENGKIYGLIGRNGIGKTTILKCMSGLCEADALKLSTDVAERMKMKLGICDDETNGGIENEEKKHYRNCNAYNCSNTYKHSNLYDVVL